MKQRPEATTGTVRAIAVAVTDRRVKPEYFSGANARVLSKVLARLPRPARESAVASALGVKGIRAPRETARTAWTDPAGFDASVLDDSGVRERRVGGP
jgi:hypothetical protein